MLRSCLRLLRKWPCTDLNLAQATRVTLALLTLVSPESLSQHIESISAQFTILPRTASHKLDILRSRPDITQGSRQVPYLLGGKVLHASGHLVGTGYQVLGGELLLGVVAGVVTVFQPRRPPGLQVLSEVALGGILHDDVQRTWGGGRRMERPSGQYAGFASPGENPTANGTP